MDSFDAARLERPRFIFPPLTPFLDSGIAFLLAHRSVEGRIRRPIVVASAS